MAEQELHRGATALTAPPLDSMLNVAHFEAECPLRKSTDPSQQMAFTFFSMGAEEEHTLRENERAWRRLVIRPRVLRDVSNIDLCTTVRFFKKAVSSSQSNHYYYCQCVLFFSSCG